MYMGHLHYWSATVVSEVICNLLMVHYNKRFLLTRMEIFYRVCDIINVFSKANTKRRRVNTYIVKWRSIFLFLPYWKDLLLYHNLDVMHIENKMCDHIVRTLLDIDEKPIGNLNARKDLKRCVSGMHFIR